MLVDLLFRSFCRTEKSVVPSAAGDYDVAVDDRRCGLNVPGVVSDFLETTAGQRPFRVART
jgi:hypothetical protein